jgi:CheY-like chemotaxis protein
MSAVFVTADLMFSSRAEHAASRAGLLLRVVAGPESALDACRECETALVILDLSSADLDVRRLVAQLRELPSKPKRIVAFAPHVHTHRLDEAREAGCDEVLTRGQFHNRLGEVFARQSV